VLLWLLVVVANCAHHIIATTLNDLGGGVVVDAKTRRMMDSLTGYRFNLHYLKKLIRNIIIDSIFSKNDILVSCFS
jgi:hypothetical protein